MQEKSESPRFALFVLCRERERNSCRWGGFAIFATTTA